MNEEAKYAVTLEFYSTGADKEVRNLRELQRAIDKVSKSGDLSEGSQRRLTNTINSSSKAMGDGGNAAEGYRSNIISLRYANYDLASSFLGVAAGIGAVGVATAVAFAQQESAFTDVERIVDSDIASIQNLRRELQDMSTEIPKNFQELSQIASLGGALGIDAGALDEFTSTVAKFTALTGVSEEAAATGFGRISQYLNLTEEQYESLGSAIVKAGNISVATEEQVLKFSQAIALPASRAGLLTDEVVALGAATASFANINVEGAGSAFSRVFGTIERSVAEGGDSLNNFAKAAGMSASEFQVAWGSEAGKTFNRVLQGLSGDVQNLTGNLDTLGIMNERDRRIISALALNYQAYNNILGQTTNAWREGVYMQESYGLVLDDVNSKWTILVNALTNAAAAMGSTLAPALSTIMELATGVLVAFANFAQTGVGEWFLRFAGTAAFLAASWLALRGVIALVTGSLLAFRFVAGAVGGPGIIAGLKALATAFVGVGTAASAGSVGVSRLKWALAGLGRMLVIGAVLQYIAEWLFNTGGAAQQLGNVMIWLADAIANVANKLGPIMGALGALGTMTLKGWGKDLKSWGKDLSDQQNKVDQFAGSAGDLGVDLDALMGSFDGASDSAGNLGNSMGDAGNAAQDLAKEVRTLVDYGNDLRQVWDRAFDIRFSGQSTLDAVTSTFITMQEAIEESSKQIRNLNSDILQLTSDIKLEEYFLEVAIKYGDTKRAAALEASLAKKRADLAEKTENLQSEQDKATKSLIGNSKGAIENRKRIQSLVQQYQAHIGALASSGMSQADLAAATARLKQDFMAQATQLGYNSKELEEYAAAFDDVTTAISLVPRNITVTANANPAIQAFNEMKAAADRASSAASGLRGNLAGGGFSIPEMNTRGARQQALQSRLNTLVAWQQELIRSGNVRGALSVDGSISQLQWDLRNGNYWTGGFTGSGGMFEPAGVVHKGEYVIPKRDVNQSTGLPYADALGRLMGGVSSTAKAPATRSPSTMMVELSPTDRALLRSAGGSGEVVLYANNEAIARSANEGNKNIVAMGGRP